jgi:hypothetical protein
MTMKRILLGLGAALTLITSFAYIPPDFYQEKYLPSIGFWKNYGQVIGTDGLPQSTVKFYTTGSIPQVYLRDKSRVSFAMHKADTLIATTDTVYHLQMQPWGEHAADREPVGTVLKDSHLNYHLPHCGPAGITEVEGYSRVLYENIFPFIDLHFYSGGFGQKMALVCRPGANPDHINLRFSGQDSLNQDLWGNLLFYHDGHYFVLPHAVAYQVNLDETTIPVSWNATYDADGNAGTVKFEWSSYDPTKPLVFLVGPPPAMGGQVNTPGVCWGTYLGGDGGDRIYASDTDEEGNYYAGGFTYSQAIYFPIGTGVVTFEASPVAFVSKFGTGYQSRWSTFYGGSLFVGSSPHQWVRGLAARPGSDPSIVIGGRTATSNLACVDPLDGSYYVDTSPGGGGFLAELNSVGAIIWSTYFGEGEISVLNIDLHPTGTIAVCGSTKGPLPPEQDAAPPEAEHWPFAGPPGLFGGDGFIALLKPERRTYWTTYIGGSAFDYLKSVRFGDEKVVFLGFTESVNFPTQDGGPDAHDFETAGDYDVTISEFTLGGDLTWGTHLGGTGGEQPSDQGLAIRSSSLGTEDVFVVGGTGSADMPFEPGTGYFNNTFIPFSGGSGFIARFSGADRSLLWLTYVNGESLNFGETNLAAVAIDRTDRLFIGGYTLTDGFPFQPAWQLYSTYEEYGEWDGILMCFSPDQQLVWSTRYGGEESGIQGERIETICTWSDERLYVAGITHTSFNPQNFFPFTDPIGDDDYFDGAFYPEWDSFLAGFCIEGLLTSVSDGTIASGLSATMMAPGVFELTGVTIQGTPVLVLDALGRTIQYRSGLSSIPLRIDLSREAVGAYVVKVAGVGAITLRNIR